MARNYVCYLSIMRRKCTWGWRGLAPEKSTFFKNLFRTMEYFRTPSGSQSGIHRSEISHLQYWVLSKTFITNYERFRRFSLNEMDCTLKFLKEWNSRSNFSVHLIAFSILMFFQAIKFNFISSGSLITYKQCKKFFVSEIWRCVLFLKKT